MNKLVEKYRKMPIQVKAAFWYVICSFFQKGLSFITIPIFTRILSIEEYGFCSVYTSWNCIWDNIASLSLAYNVFSVGVVKFEKDKRQFLVALQGLSCVSVSICFFIYTCFCTMFEKFAGLPFKLMALMFMSILVNSILNLWYSYERYFYNYKKFLIVTVISSIFGSILSVLLVFNIKDKVFARFAGSVVIQFILCILVCVYEREKGIKYIHKKYWKYALRFSVPLIPHYLSSTILNSSDRIMIAEICGNDKAALYGIAGSCSMIMTILLTAVNSSITPWYYEQLKLRSYVNLRKKLNLIIFVFGCLTFVITLFAPELLKLLATEEYTSALKVIPVVVLSVFFWFLYGLFANIEFYFERKKGILFASLSVAMQNILLNAIFIPIFGYYAAGYTTLVCYIIHAIIHYSFARKIMLENMIKSMFDEKVIVLFSIILLILVATVSVLYQYQLIRYILSIIIMFLIFCLYRTKLKDIKK